MIHRSITPVLLAPAYIDAARPLMARRIVVDKPPPGAFHIREIGCERRPYEVVGDIAVIGVSGLLLDKFPWLNCGWVTGYDGLRVQLSFAFADPDVRKIVLDIDSGGGYVAGCFDLCDWIVAERKKSGKPIAAICTESAYSAAYAIASCADSIAVPRTGGVGSIGVVVTHVDISAALEEWGQKVTIVQSGAHKTDGTMLKPLPDDVKADFQASVDDLRALFAETVARNRKISVKTVMDTEARCFDGPSGTAQAVKIRLADAVLSPEKAFQAFAKF